MAPGIGRMPLPSVFDALQDPSRITVSGSLDMEADVTPGLTSLSRLSSQSSNERSISYFWRSS